MTQHMKKCVHKTKVFITVCPCALDHKLSRSHKTYDLVPCDFFLFPKLKTHLKGHHFGTVENVQAAATRALNNISSEHFLHCYEQWQQRWNRCIRSQGAYFEGDKL
ncbi:hypothetical protein Cfor_07169 [Coptotermes formosanus]|uniref:Uncharacterized protein n=1 Tax=Coptotermes formosanus TaxID=36987 RepID=A0A6L2PXS5_COPFO|nr:hypothetical protein Cfor_07169 [Coptotermes formosanus]